MYPELALPKCQASKERGTLSYENVTKIMHGQKDYPGTLLWVLNSVPNGSTIAPWVSEVHKSTWSMKQFRLNLLVTSTNSFAFVPGADI